MSFDPISYAMGKAAGGGGGGSSVTVESLSATENKTYTAPEGTAYSPVVVNVPVGLPVITGSTNPTSAKTLEISAPSGVNFGDYNRIALLAYDSFIWVEAPCSIHLYMNTNGNVLWFYDPDTGNVGSTVPTVSFSATKVTISNVDADFEIHYNYVVWKE